VDLRLEGKRALVTGASAGTGTAIAEMLAAEGAPVIVHGRDAGRTRRVRGRLRDAGGTAEAVLGDLSTSDGARAVALGARDAFGGVDILVNNAGLIGSYEDWDDTDDADWARMYDRVVILLVRLIQALKADMVTAGWGRIINISSAQSGQPFGMMPAAKSALHTLTKSLSKHLDRTGVSANVISPGIIVTDRIRDRMTEAAAAEGRTTEWDDIERHVLETELDNPSGRLARPEDVAYAVAFFASPLAGYVNGANIRVDGGSNTSINP